MQLAALVQRRERHGLLHTLRRLGSGVSVCERRRTRLGVRNAAGARVRDAIGEVAPCDRLAKRLEFPPPHSHARGTYPRLQPSCPSHRRAAANRHHRDPGDADDAELAADAFTPVDAAPPRNRAWCSASSYSSCSLCSRRHKNGWAGRLKVEGEWQMRRRQAIVDYERFGLARAQVAHAGDVHAAFAFRAVGRGLVLAVASREPRRTKKRRRKAVLTWPRLCR